MKPIKKPLFKIPNLKKGTFISRENRFACTIEYKEERESAHLHDPGRLTELLKKGTEILFNESKGKLTYYIRAVKKEGEYVLVDSAQHSKIARKVFQYLPELSGFQEIRSEVSLGRSRIDFVLDGTPLEVKGVSLVKNGTALFPDAPTKRGTRHVKEILKHEGIILFLILRKAENFVPNFETDPEFAKALKKAREKEIMMIPVQISFDGETLFYEGKIKLGDF
jgi:sugar fermentation stimulation protein A